MLRRITGVFTVTAGALPLLAILKRLCKHAAVYSTQPNARKIPTHKSTSSRNSGQSQGKARMKIFSALQLGKIKVGLGCMAGDSIIQCSEFYGTGVWGSIPVRAWIFTVLRNFHMD